MESASFGVGVCKLLALAFIFSDSHILWQAISTDMQKMYRYNYKYYYKSKYNFYAYYFAVQMMKILMSQRSVCLLYSNDDNWQMPTSYCRIYCDLSYQSCFMMQSSKG